MFTAATVHTSLLLIVLGLGLSTVACGGAGDDGSDPTTDSNESSEDELRAVSVTGTYQVGIGTGAAFDYDTLKLASNHTFTAVKGKAHIAGSWSASKGALALTKTGETKPTTLFYSISGAILRLSTTLHGKYSLFFKDGVSFPKVDVGEVCSDKLGNIIAECPENFACEFDGSNSKLQRCWPDR